MRLMIGRGTVPALLVTVNGNYDPSNFTFTVINGCWDGVFYNGHITVLGCPSGSFSDVDGDMEILCDNQDRLRSERDDDYMDEYSSVFANFDNPLYVAPLDPERTQRTLQWLDDLDDDIPF